MTEVFGLLEFVFQTFFVGKEKDIICFWLNLGREIDSLWNILNLMKGCSCLQAVHQLLDRFFSHAVDEQIGGAVDEDTRPQMVLPVIVVRQAAHGGFDTAQYDWHVGVEFLQNFGVNNAGVIGPHTGTAIGRVSIIATQPLVGGVVIDHRIHRSGRHAEEQTGRSQLLEVAEITPPIGLRDDRHP